MPRVSECTLFPSGRGSEGTRGDRGRPRRQPGSRLCEPRRPSALFYCLGGGRLFLLCVVHNVDAGAPVCRSVGPRRAGVVGRTLWRHSPPASVRATGVCPPTDHLLSIHYFSFHWLCPSHPTAASTRRTHSCRHGGGGAVRRWPPPHAPRSAAHAPRPTRRAAARHVGARRPPQPPAATTALSRHAAAPRPHASAGTRPSGRRGRATPHTVPPPPGRRAV
ncbi:hypothetical protein BU14_3015s0001 [Porphyra umbilicalis]|uniref:Uncharacterized protein n=1 Tax=Porphyra umbilicalis TaxID=2786 RepID=A0A1X6NIG4_PORUM|nr:hypothetical protein BU14_3015s0001 [Porphyra umbilicalis]|eukprot:OSX68320.1 hypothetical protein BU14_3015s0001 [Porphyra umbilicalis]